MAVRQLGRVAYALGGYGRQASRKQARLVGGDTSTRKPSEVKRVNQKG